MPCHTSIASPRTRTLWLLGLAGALLAALVQAPATTAQTAAWEPWQHVPGVADVGARSDGNLLVMAGGRFGLVSRTGQASPFANGADGFTGVTPDAESYFVVVPVGGLAVQSAGCAFAADDVFVLDLTTPPGVVHIDPAGHAARFASLAGVDTLGGIALDATGAFDHRLLLTGTHDNQTTVFAIDCQGGTTVLTTTAPLVEGGIAVAPASFGQFGGALVAPDENSGQLWAIDPTGNATLILVPNLPAGGDTGVESLGFVPRGFSSAAGFAYLADRGTPNNPFPGTDSLLRLSAATLAAAGVQDGDLLIATEGGGTTIAVHCEATCSVIQAAAGTPGGHIEGHLLAVIDQRP